jgi:hypothetical protein
MQLLGAEEMMHDDILKFLEDGKVFRRFTLLITLWMTWRSFAWAAELATAWIATGKPGLEFAAVIAAVLAPMSYVQKAVFDAYVKEGS